MAWSKRNSIVYMFCGSTTHDETIIGLIKASPYHPAYTRFDIGRDADGKWYVSVESGGHWESMPLAQDKMTEYLDFAAATNVYQDGETACVLPVRANGIRGKIRWPRLWYRAMAINPAPDFQIPDGAMVVQTRYFGEQSAFDQCTSDEERAAIALAHEWSPSIGDGSAYDDSVLYEDALVQVMADRGRYVIYLGSGMRIGVAI